MLVVLQRVEKASVTIEKEVHGAIDKGLLLLVGFEPEDTVEDISWMTRKVVQMRIFSDENGKMNLSLNDVNGSILVISQFTLHASIKKGNRPSFIKAASPDVAIPLYESFKMELTKIAPASVESGVFGANMSVALINDGPVTILIDSKNKI